MSEYPRCLGAASPSRRAWSASRDAARDRTRGARPTVGWPPKQEFKGFLKDSGRTLANEKREACSRSAVADDEAAGGSRAVITKDTTVCMSLAGRPSNIGT